MSEYRMTIPSDDIDDRQSLRTLFKKLSKTNGLVSIFWVTENDRRASAIQRLEDSGNLILDNSVGFPWFKVKWIEKQ